ncbi:unnamed protein product [Closterium sp. Yama58-4]|nr:unnamed protein product [Closterium sp. Yama58-4]
MCLLLSLSSPQSPSHPIPHRAWYSNAHGDHAPAGQQRQQAERGGSRSARSMLACFHPLPSWVLPLPTARHFNTPLPDSSSSDLRWRRLNRLECRDLRQCDVSRAAEIHTEGVVAKDVFTVSYHGGPLDDEMTTLALNAIHYTFAARY